MANNNKNKIDYLIVKTGYTSRIINVLGIDTCKEIKEEDTQNKYKGYHDKPGRSKIFKIGYSFDTNTKKGLIKIIKNFERITDAFKIYDTKAINNDDIERFNCGEMVCTFLKNILMMVLQMIY